MLSKIAKRGAYVTADCLNDMDLDLSFADLYLLLFVYTSRRACKSEPCGARVCINIARNRLWQKPRRAPVKQGVSSHRESKHWPLFACTETKPRVKATFLCEKTRHFCAQCAQRAQILCADLDSLDLDTLSISQIRILI